MGPNDASSPVADSASDRLSQLPLSGPEHSDSELAFGHHLLNGHLENSGFILRFRPVCKRGTKLDILLDSTRFGGFEEEYGLIQETNFNF